MKGPGREQETQILEKSDKTRIHLPALCPPDSHKYFLCTYEVTSTILGSRDLAVKRQVEELKQLKKCLRTWVYTGGQTLSKVMCVYSTLSISYPWLIWNMQELKEVSTAITG